MKKRLALIFLSASFCTQAEPGKFSSWDSFALSTNPSDVALAKKIRNANWWDMCEKYGKLLRLKKDTDEFKAIRLFVQDDMLNGIDLMNIDVRKIEVGMTQCGVFASLGMPERVNSSTNVYGSRAQLVYRNSTYRYVYTREVRGQQLQLVDAFSN